MQPKPFLPITLSRKAGLVFINFCAFILSCSPEIAQVDLPYTLPDNFSKEGEAETKRKWWLAFDDASLHALIDTALNENLSLQGVWYQLEESRAVLNQSSSFLLPDINLQLQSGISRPEPDFVGGENSQISLGASYEVDLWGRIRYGMHADQYRVEATYYDYQTAAISLSSEIALTWFRLKTAKSQINLLDSQIETNEQVLALIRVRFGSGLVRGVDILRQEQLIEATRAQRIALETQVGVLQNQLAVLLGKPPGAELLQSNDQLPSLPSLPKTGVPLQLVNRRPDILSAYNQLQAADRELAASISNQYPRLNFGLTAAVRSNTFTDILQSQAVSLSGRLLMPLFYGGRLKAQVNQSEAIRQQRLRDYGQAVLVAFQEVENALLREQQQQRTIEKVEAQVDLAERAYQQLRIEYLNGTSEYLDVLTTLNQAQQLRRDLIDARMTLLDIRIALYRALAGSVDTGQKPSGS